MIAARTPLLPISSPQQVVRRAGLQRTMKWGPEEDSDIVVAFKERSSIISLLGAPLVELSKGAQPPRIQILYFGAAPRHSGAT